MGGDYCYFVFIVVVTRAAFLPNDVVGLFFAVWFLLVKFELLKLFY